MNICTDKKEEMKFVAGKLYEINNDLHLYTSSGKMVYLKTGQDNIYASDRSLWKDVTDSYCLQKVK